MRTPKWIVFLDGLATTVTRIQEERQLKEEEKILFIAFLKQKCSIFFIVTTVVVLVKLISA